MLEIRVPAWSGSSDIYISGCGLLTFYCILSWKEKLATSLASSLKNINLIYEGFILMIFSHPKGLNSKYHPIRLGVNI